MDVPTNGQLERDLSQQVQAFYREHLGHQPLKITCQIFDQKVTFVIENSLTPTEQLLLKEGKEKLANSVHACLDEITQPQIKQLIESALNVEVTDLLSDATLETGRTGIIAILSESPQVRYPTASAKRKKT